MFLSMLGHLVGWPPRGIPACTGLAEGLREVPFKCMYEPPRIRALGNWRLPSAYCSLVRLHRLRAREQGLQEGHQMLFHEAPR